MRLIDEVVVEGGLVDVDGNQYGALRAAEIVESRFVEKSDDGSRVIGASSQPSLVAMKFKS